jgi:hypothetical protein
VSSTGTTGATIHQRKDPFHLYSMNPHLPQFNSLVSLSNGPKSANKTVLISIWSRAGAYNQTELAADIGPRILRFYEEYFNTSFPLPKQDMIAIPGKREIIQAITINVPVVKGTVAPD